MLKERILVHCLAHCVFQRDSLSFPYLTFPTLPFLSSFPFLSFPMDTQPSCLSSCSLSSRKQQQNQFQKNIIQIQIQNSASMHRCREEKRRRRRRRHAREGDDGRGERNPDQGVLERKAEAIEKKRRQEFEIHCEGLQGMAMLMRYKRALRSAQYQDETLNLPFALTFNR